mgnify:CR=1 FL=1
MSEYVEKLFGLGVAAHRPEPRPRTPGHYNAIVVGFGDANADIEKLCTNVSDAFEDVKAYFNDVGFLRMIIRDKRLEEDNENWITKYNNFIKFIFGHSFILTIFKM